jgi:glucose-1-phosphate adenylyltransferase
MRDRILGMIMAGGKGVRLYPLTRERSKPAVPIGGKYRIIDFVLSSFINSEIYSIYVLVQFKSQSLQDHLREGWQFSGLLKDHFITTVPAQQRTSGSWYKGTADAIYQNLHLVRNSKASVVAIFGADHIYKMNIQQMVNYHYRRAACATVAALPVPAEKAHQFGVIEVDRDWRMVGFEEKPDEPKTLPGQPGLCLISLGNYLFRTDVLIEELERDAERDSEHDFGRSILPEICRRRNVYVYDFRKNSIPESLKGEEPSYWRDIGTIEEYYEANMDLKNIDPAFNLYNRSWPVHTVSYGDPPAKFIFDEEERRGVAIDSIVSEGCIISGGVVKDSVLGRNVQVHSYSMVQNSILMSGVSIGRRCRLNRVIIDKNIRVPPGTTIGLDPELDAKRFHVTETGIVVIPVDYEWETEPGGG